MTNEQVTADGKLEIWRNNIVSKLKKQFEDDVLAAQENCLHLTITDWEHISGFGGEEGRICLDCCKMIERRNR